MGQILHTDIWPLLTSAEVNIRVAYEQKENLPIPKYITWNNSITKHSHIHLNNHAKYASWNKWVLVRDLKMSRDGDLLMLRGRLFHSIGAAAAKDLLPKFSNRHRGDVSWWFSLDRRVRVGEYGTSCSRRYAGASPFRALYVSRRILKSILCFTGSQCRSTRTGVMWSYFRHWVMTRAAWFWRIWSWVMSSLGMPNIKLLQ